MSLSRKKTPRSGKPWSVLLLTAVLLVSLAFVGATFFALIRNAKHEQEWTGLATEIQVASQQLAKSAGEAASGNLVAFTELAATHERMNQAMTLLQGGSGDGRLPPAPAEVEEQVGQLGMTWARMSANAASIRDREALLLALAEASSVFSRILPGIQRDADAAVRELTQSDAPGQQVFIASLQLTLAERLLRRVSEILQGGSNAVSAADNLSKEMQIFDEVSSALLGGSQELGITQVRSQQALALLDRIRTQFAQARPHLQTILDSSTDLFEVRGAADEVFLDSRLVFSKAARLADEIAGLPQSRPWPSLRTGVIGLVFMVAVVALLVSSVIASERQRATVATSRNRHNQRAIKRLLSELSSLADGDLTVQATVTEEITSEIAGAVNYAIQRLRELVTGINDTARSVADSAQATRTSASELANAAGTQADQVDAATDDVRQMAVSFDTMAQRAHSSSEVAHKSVDIAHNGAEKVRETISGMDTIRGQIQETSKRIKRLGESTQEIGDIIGLINGIAEQTNVLALNAAIQAASAGGAGKGFAVVADEVQQLAESATQATRRIETLVQTIQADTSEAVHSMEATTSEVVSGARLAEDAGAALEQIETVSNNLSVLIEEISTEAQTQSETTTRISELMQGIRDVSIQTSDGSKQTAAAIENLAELVLRLRESVSDFKLPQGG